MYTPVYIYIYIIRIYMRVCVSIHIYVYVYIYIYRERDVVSVCEASPIVTMNRTILMILITLL